MIYLGLSEKDGIPNLWPTIGEHTSSTPIQRNQYLDDIKMISGYMEVSYKNRATPSYHPFIDRFFPLTIHLGYPRGHGNRLSRRP